MSTRRRPSRSDLARAAIGLAAVALVAAAPAREARADDASAYVVPTPMASASAGVRVDRLTPAGLSLHVRDDRAPAEGGVTLSYADAAKRVRVVLRVAVAPDAAGAKAFVERALRGVSGALAPSDADEVAFGDPSDRLLIAARGNVAYSVEVLEGSLASARAIASNVRRAFVSGAPTFPRATVSLPPTVERSAPIAIAVPPGAHYRLAATGAYVAKGESGPVLRPFAKGPVSVTAIVSDELGRVTEVTATSLAR